MKTLILYLAILSPASYAVDEVVTKEDQSALATQIKDVEVEHSLNQTKEFASCRAENTFAENDPDKDKKIKAAQDCFKDKLKDFEKNPEALKKFSEALDLQQYGLVKSNSMKDLQVYLNAKMYKSLTGVDPEEKDLKKLMESMKFKNKKNVDQGLFIRLYKMQLNKNIMLEISRFCFEDLRLDSPPAPATAGTETFSAHWKTYTKGFMHPKNVSNVTDTGEPKFGIIQDPNDKAKVFEDILSSVKVGNGGMNPLLLKDFYTECGSMIVPLCDEFKLKNKNKLAENKSQTDVDNSQLTPKGAAACLTKDRLLKLKKAIADTELVAKQMNELEGGPNFDQLIQKGMKGQPIPVYRDGHGTGEENLDSLTNYSSKDIIEGGHQQNSEMDKKAEECELNPDVDSCKGFISSSDDFEKAKHNIEMDMTLKKEVEIARVKALKAEGETKLKEYLEKNGYYQMLEKLEAGTLTNTMIEEEIGNEFAAKKVSLLAAINDKIGKRQAKKQNGQSTVTSTQAKDVISETKEERARLAQVILFNNIITSHLELKDANDKDLGRNTGAWKKEEQDLTTAKVDNKFFDNLKTQDDGKTSDINPEDMAAGNLLDGLLGKPPETKKPNN